MKSKSSKTMKRNRRQYSTEFKAEAVRLAQAPGQSIAAVAKDLGIGDGLLRGWIRQAAIDSGNGPHGALTTVEKEENSEVIRAGVIQAFEFTFELRELPLLLETVDDLKVYLQLAHELTCLSHAQYQELSQSVSIIGKMLGGMKRYFESGTNMEAMGQHPC